ncbi:MAG: Fe-Mn family superoxide dismutase [Candidatus Paceibacterota bacterium]
MKPFIAKTFTIPALKGISAKNIEEHLKLYAGYVKNTNSIMESFGRYNADPIANSYVMGELGRRFSFEYNGMRNHEVYFSSLEGGARSLKESSLLKKMVAETWGSFDGWLNVFKSMATTTRGIGWAVLWYDRNDDQLLASWVDEQHLGELNGCDMILGLDMWEHSYVADYQPSGKKQYVEDFFANLNWEVIEENLKRAK